MNRFIAVAWDGITDDESLLAELTAIMSKEYKPFLSQERTVKANTHQLEHHMIEQVTEWYEWLPDIPINQIGGELAMKMLQEVDWSHIAKLLGERS